MGLAKGKNKTLAMEKRMHIIIARAVLLRSLGHVKSVVGRRNNTPILANVLLKARDGEIDLVATDRDLEIVETVPATVNVAGGITAPAHTLYDIIRKLPDGSQVEIKVDADGSQMTLRSGRSHFKLSCLPIEDFPQLSWGELRHRFALTASKLRRLIDRTSFAISTEETRYYLNGIYLHAARAGAEPTLRAVATDGHLLAQVDTTLPVSAADMPGVIVPRKTIAEVRKLINKVTDRIEVSLSENKIRFVFDTVVLTSKLIDGKFPDYERVIPVKNDKVLEVDVKRFAAATKRIAAGFIKKDQVFKLAIGKGVLTLSAANGEAGSASEELEVRYEHTAIEIGFNPRYLLDIIQRIEGDRVLFVLANAASPVLIRDAADSSALYVLMPKIIR